MKRTLFVLLFFCATFNFAYSQQTATPVTGTKKPVTIESIYRAPDIAKAEPQSLQWSPDGKKISFLRKGKAGEEQALYYYDPTTGKDAVLVAADRMASLDTPPPAGGTKGDDRQRDNRARYGVAAYHWAPDSGSILFDRMGTLWLYDLRRDQGLQVTFSADTSTDPKFSPNGKYVSFVRKHNLFVMPLSGGREIALTSNGNENLLNGEVDWVYEEELDVRSNYVWSPDSQQILFLQMNETSVPTYPIVDWMPTHPTVYNMKYPKAGDPNPTVKLGVLDLQGKTKWLSLTANADIYIPRFGWLSPTTAWAMVLNRRQNQQDLYFIDVATGNSKLVLSEKDPYYIELTDSYYFFKSGDRFIWPSWRDGFTHLYLYTFNSKEPLAAEAKLERQLTKGEFEVSAVNSVDESNSTVYFTSNKDDDRQETLYSVNLDGSTLTRISHENGCHHTTIAPNSKYYIDTYSTLLTQAKMQICTVTGKCNQIWQSKTWDGYDLLPPQFVDFKAEDGTVLHGMLMMPSSEMIQKMNGKVPLIMSPYGGPHGQVVRDEFNGSDPFDQILAHEGIAVLKVDNRGMGNRGRKFAVATFHNNGEIELQDQLAALRQASEKFPQIDGSKLGWWGWSYGGSMTLDAMTHSELFKAGVSVAPVTDWRNYDSIYTERYMGLPSENAAGYDKTSLVKSAPNLKGKLLIVHGTSDDNVHMQNTLQFANALINSGKQFDLMMYPLKTHSISGQAARIQLFHEILNHFEENLLNER